MPWPTEKRHRDRNSKNLGRTHITPIIITKETITKTISSIKMTLPEPVVQALDKIDAFMAKYPTVSQYGEGSFEW